MVLFDDFSKWKVPDVVQDWEKSSTKQKFGRNEENHVPNFYSIILITAFGTKNVHTYSVILHWSSEAL